MNAYNFVVTPTTCPALNITNANVKPTSLRTTKADVNATAMVVCYVSYLPNPRLLELSPAMPMLPGLQYLRFVNENFIF